MSHLKGRGGGVEQRARKIGSCVVRIHFVHATKRLLDLTDLICDWCVVRRNVNRLYTKNWEAVSILERFPGKTWQVPSISLADGQVYEKFCSTWRGIGRRRKWNELALRNLKICHRRERSYLRDLVIEVRREVSCNSSDETYIFPHVHPRIRAVTIRIGRGWGGWAVCRAVSRAKTIYCSTCQKRRRIFY